jgi:hypothetical protein
LGGNPHPRNRYLYYGKNKPKVLYQKEYCEGISAVDHATKLGYDEMYKNESSRSPTDFLCRLRYLVNHPVENLQTGNGGGFNWEFERATVKSGIQRYFSRVETVKDNPEIERFNETSEYEMALRL